MSPVVQGLILLWVHIQHTACPCIMPYIHHKILGADYLAVPYFYGFRGIWGPLTRLMSTAKSSLGISTQSGLVLHICINDQGCFLVWFGWWLVAWSAPSHHPNQRRLIQLDPKEQYSVTSKSISKKEIPFENAFCKLSAILLSSQSI